MSRSERIVFAFFICAFVVGCEGSRHSHGYVAYGINSLGPGFRLPSKEEWGKVRFLTEDEAKRAPQHPADAKRLEAAASHGKDFLTYYKLRAGISDQDTKTALDKYDFLDLDEDGRRKLWIRKYEREHQDAALRYSRIAEMPLK